MANTTSAPTAHAEPGHQGAWGAVYAMTLCTFVLIASEFMPVSLLSPIAADLHLTNGQAGQAISVSGLFAMIASLSLGTLTRSVDRRAVLLALTSLLILSGALTALTPNYFMLIVARGLVGIAIGGFWSMSAAMAMRLVPERSVPRALAIMNGGNAIASVVAAPLGSFAGGIIGWRGAFFCVVPLAIVAVVWQAFAVPRLPPVRHAEKSGMLALLQRRIVVRGLLGAAMFFMGQFALFTYLRPFLEQVSHVSLPTLSSLLLTIGISGLIGTTLIGRAIGPRLHILLAINPAIMGAIGICLALFGGSVIAIALLLSIWGLIATSTPVAWWTWLTRAAPDDAEAAGGLMVAIVQFAIMSGASLGGQIYDMFGPSVEFIGSAGILLIAALIALACDTRPAARSR
jgi:predicted MFS family arabinose efflux permease